MPRLIAILALLTLTSACSNEANTEIHLGAVSVGQQLIDLTAAKSAGAITEAEYEAAKASILRMVDELSDSLER